MNKKCAHSLAKAVLVWLIILSGAGCRIFTDDYPGDESNIRYRKEHETNDYMFQEGTMLYIK
jgi:hypothetical protein